MSYVMLAPRPCAFGIGEDTFAKESGELEDLPTANVDTTLCAEGLKTVQVRNQWGHILTIACAQDCPEGFKEYLEWCVTPEEYNQIQSKEKVAIAEKKHRVIKTVAVGAGAAALLAFLI